jgi:translation initiation factor 2 subunit 2
MSYKELLERARKQLPSDVSEHKRFEVPRPRSHIVGMRTILPNFKEICEALNRDPRHVLKFFSREMATAATMQNNRAIFQGKFGYDTFERLIQRYINEFVVCPVCTRPDTKIVKDRRFLFLVCEACGARSSVSTL